MELNTKEERNKKLENYYRVHSIIYDWTRWSFLFGREELLNRIPDLPANPRILEIGCGTGKNLAHLEFLFPDAQIYGIDLSEDMIEQASKKVSNGQQVQLINGAYGDSEFQFEPFNLILLSYSLSMLGRQAEPIMEQVYSDLANDGYIAIVDFYTTPFNWFQRWMEINHVDMDGHLLSLLDTYFMPMIQHRKKAYLGLWDYLLYIGRRKPSALL
ncbi:class I SAM-dependent methyltransferase [Aliifodinibius sp. S!AR15-10]|uniref:class I SAM-dependent methyltransferase n=1 Tax=Aliifodinibius sp. S!AR15-10 TaxID=2950437 RepID=UPI00285A779B|nr:class I SAM-dependent methyltransferase [Aliifodinibius sp. S!AR15-10]MDR8390944.1 class I SAM-dependent methyltransferase [Aliifodinibius sp. S!AR15-10]